MTIGTDPGLLLVVLLCAALFIADKAAALGARHGARRADAPSDQQDEATNDEPND